MKFDRVEAGSIVSMGLGKALQKCGSLLKSSAENPHATLIVLFMNGTHLAENALGNDYFVRTCPSIMKPTLQFVPGKLRPGKASALTVHRLQAKELLRDLDHLFTHHMRMKDFDKASREAGLKMKAANTVVDEWPLRLRKEYGEPGAQEDFDRLIVSGSRGDERYVEWVRSG